MKTMEEYISDKELNESLIEIKEQFKEDQSGLVSEIHKELVNREIDLNSLFSDDPAIQEWLRTILTDEQIESMKVTHSMHNVENASFSIGSESDDLSIDQELLDELDLVEQEIADLNAETAFTNKEDEIDYLNTEPEKLIKDYEENPEQIEEDLKQKEESVKKFEAHDFLKMENEYIENSEIVYSENNSSLHKNGNCVGLCHGWSSRNRPKRVSLMGDPPPGEVILDSLVRVEEKSIANWKVTEESMAVLEEALTKGMKAGLIDIQELKVAMGVGQEVHDLIESLKSTKYTLGEALESENQKNEYEIGSSNIIEESNSFDSDQPKEEENKKELKQEAPEEKVDKFDPKIEEEGLLEGLREDIENAPTPEKKTKKRKQRNGVRR